MRINRLLFVSALALGCGGGGQNPSTPAQPAAPPPIGSFSAAPSGVPIAAVTVMTFTGNGTDAQGGALTFSWQFGDGQTANGISVMHVFPVEGTFPVAMTIRSANGASATITNPITVRSITGNWVDLDPDFVMHLQQSGPNFSGTLDFQRAKASDIDGVLTNPRDIKFHRQSYDPRRFFTGDYVGTVDSAVNKIKVEADRLRTFELTRQ